MPDAEAAFWTDVSASGSPVVETEDAPAGEALVTFVWKGSAATESVHLVSGPQITESDLAFRHLENSNVWFLSLHLPLAWRVGYLVIENGEKHGYPKGGDWMKFAICDPLNRTGFEMDSAAPKSGSMSYSIFETPGAPLQRWLRRRAASPSGNVELRTLRSRILGEDREVYVYTPYGYDAGVGAPYGTLFLFDGDMYRTDMQVAVVLDNLIDDHLIPPLVAVLVRNLRPGSARDRELQCDPKFTEFFTSELVPWARQSYRITKDPRGTIVGGVSLGALEAAYIASRHSDLFGGVLAQSGAFWWRPTDEPAASNEPWMSGSFLREPRVPVRFFLSVGKYEGSGTSDNRKMRDALVAKGYSVEYQEVECQHDPINWRLTFPDGLIALAGRSRK